MRILRVHDRYQQQGGEDVVNQLEIDLLAARGHDVMPLVVSNDDIPPHPSARQCEQLAVETVWSRCGQHLVGDAIREFRPDVVHFDNTFPLISPAAYVTCQAMGVPVVQTLHNYRLICPGATLFHDGHSCEDCVGKLVPWPGVVRGCYRDSRSETAAVAAMLAFHRIRGTWTRHVDRYIALTEFAKSRFVAGGIPAHLITVKPNFVDRRASTSTRSFTDFLFVGRLAPEKGIDVLLEASQILASEDLRIRVIGDGTLLESVTEATRISPVLQAEGRKSSAETQMAMDTATMLVFPSIWYEGFPMTILEAFASGLPVIASRLGSMAEIIDDGRTGLLFTPGSAEDLSRVMRWAARHPAEVQAMGRNARAEYERTYTPERNYRLLMDIYRQVIGTSIPDEAAESVGEARHTLQPAHR